MVKAIRRHHSLCLSDFQKPVLNPKKGKNTACESPNPGMRSTMQNETERQRKTRQMKSCKAVLWLFPIVTNTGLFFLFLFFRGVTGKLKGITFPTVSFELSSYFSLFVHIGKSSCPFLSESQKFELSECTPRHLRESGHFPPLATLCVCVFVT